MFLNMCKHKINTLFFVSFFYVYFMFVFKADVPRNINHRGGCSIFAGCLFFEIGSSSADFLDLEQCRKPSSGHMTIAARRLFGHRSIFSGNDQIFGRCPADVPPTIVRRATGDRRGSCRSLPDDNESCDHRQVTFW